MSLIVSNVSLPVIIKAAGVFVFWSQPAWGPTQEARLKTNTRQQDLSPELEQDEDQR